VATLWTLGFEGRTPAEVVSILREYRIERVVDIRWLPMEEDASFSKPALSAILANANIAYDMRRELAPKRDALDSFADTGDLDTLTEHFDTDVPDKAVAMFLRTAEGQRTAVLCKERDPHRCHREALARAVKRRGVAVKHIY
jgi:uncharacterized protein (DUF488 family)